MTTLRPWPGLATPLFIALMMIAKVSMCAEASSEFGRGASGMPSAAVPAHGIGSGLGKNTKTVGFSLGPGLGLEIFGSNNTHDLALAFGHIGWILTDILARGRWYQGQLEVRGDVFGGAQLGPDSAYVVGISVGPRYNVITGTPWLPFAGVTAGVGATDIRNNDLSTTFEFNVQIGCGT